MEKYKNFLKKTEEYLHDLGFAEEFLIITPIAQSMKERTGKLNFIKIKIPLCKRHC